MCEHEHAMKKFWLNLWFLNFQHASNHILSYLNVEWLEALLFEYHDIKIVTNKLDPQSESKNFDMCVIFVGVYVCVHGNSIEGRLGS